MHCIKKETDAKNEESGNKMLNEAIRDNITNVKEYENLSVVVLRGNKVDIVEKQLFKNERLVQDLKTDAERVF